MNFRNPSFRFAALATALVCAAVAFHVSPPNAQQVQATTIQGLSTDQSPSSPLLLYSRAGQRATGFNRLAAVNSQRKEAAKLIETIKSSDATQEEQAVAQDKLAAILSEQFDQDLKAREQRIVQLEEQLKALREQISKRREAKSRLVKLRIELMVNEAEGLGFPKAWNQSMDSGANFPGWRTSPFAAPAPAVPPAPSSGAASPFAPAAQNGR